MKHYGSTLLALALTLAVFGSARAADVTGKWTSQFETQIGKLDYTYDFKLNGETLTGKAIRVLDGERTETEIKEGKVTGDNVSFVEILTRQGQELRIEYTGKLAGDELKFTRKVGDFATTEIVARREKDVVATVAGKWQAEFDTQIGKQKYVYDFKVEGEKLTGRAIGDIAGQKSDTEIADGKIKGADLSFVENVKFQGQEVRVEYKGKVAGDEIKFTRKVADVATEEMVAKRVKEPGSK